MFQNMDEQEANYAPDQRTLEILRFRHGNKVRIPLVDQPNRHLKLIRFEEQKSRIYYRGINIGILVVSLVIIPLTSTDNEWRRSVS